MSDRWADFLISRVEYSEAPRHIKRVELRLDRGETIGPPAEMSRPVVIAWLSAGYSVMTVLVRDGTATKGAKVQIVVSEGKQYIRTDADNSKADNLGSLPTF